MANIEPTIGPALSEGNCPVCFKYSIISRSYNVFDEDGEIPRYNLLIDMCMICKLYREVSGRGIIAPIMRIGFVQAIKPKQEYPYFVRRDLLIEEAKIILTNETGHDQYLNLLKNTDDITRRLVFADWCGESGCVIHEGVLRDDEKWQENIKFPVDID